MSKINNLLNGNIFIIPSPDFQVRRDGNKACVYSPDYHAEHEIFEKLPAGNWLLATDTEADAQNCNPRKVYSGEWAGYWMWQLVLA